MNTFDQLNDALFAQLEKLADADSQELIEREIERSKAVSSLATNIIGNANTAVNLMRFQASQGIDTAKLIGNGPRLLGGGKE